MAGELILAVDDNPQNLKLVSVLLRAEDYEVATAVDAEEALVFLETRKPRLILLDVQLPRMDGLELTRRLKTDPLSRDITIICLTAYAMKGDEERALAAGCDAYMSKPIDVRALARMVSGYLRK